MPELMTKQEDEPKLHPNLQKYEKGQVTLSEEDIKKMGEGKDSEATPEDDNVIRLEDRRPKEKPVVREKTLKRGQRARLEDLDKKRAEQKAKEKEALEAAREKLSNLQETGN